MISYHNYPISHFCWLSSSYNDQQQGLVKDFYEPESLAELTELCRQLYKEDNEFLVIGHTSNLYFTPNCRINTVVSTRKCNSFEINDNSIWCECGVSVMKLSKMMCLRGIAGFEGLVDLPGTVASSIYGNSSAFYCSINERLIECEVLLQDGSIMKLTKEQLQLSDRDSALKRGTINGVILSAMLKKEISSSEQLCQTAKLNSKMRSDSLPGPAHNLGSIFRNDRKRTLLGTAIQAITKLYSIILKKENKYSSEEIRKKRLKLSMLLLGARDLEPYVFSWNLYIWKDYNAHNMFQKFVKKHNKIYKNSSLEIEVIE